MSYIDNTYQMSKKEKRFFALAKSVAQTSDYDRVKIGCCVVYKGTVISVACNCNKTHPLQTKYNKYRNFDPNTYANKLHAEVHALSLVMNKDIDWKRVSIYTYRETKDGMPACSRPCIACSNLINDLGISTIYYINKKGEETKERLR